MWETSFTIKSKKQPNGLWGTPLNCTYVQKAVNLPESKELLQSAILIGIAERYPKETFGIYFQTEDWFLVKISVTDLRTDAPPMWKKIIYDEYELIGNTLVYESISK